MSNNPQPLHPLEQLRDRLRLTPESYRVLNWHYMNTATINRVLDYLLAPHPEFEDPYRQAGESLQKKNEP